MSQAEQWYPVPCPVALELHEQTFGPAPPGTSYECQWESDPSGPTSSTVRLVYMAHTYRLTVQYEDTSAVTENFAVTTHDWRYEPPQEPDATALDAIEAKMDAFFGDANVKNMIAGSVKVIGYKWAKLKDDGTGQDGAQIRLTSKNLAFTGGNGLPPQVACSVTEMTDVRKRWGRFYLPFLSATMTVNNGRPSSSQVNALATAAATMSEPIASEWQSVVYGVLVPSSIPVRSIRVDDTLDVIRSRRYRSPGVRATVTV